MTQIRDIDYRAPLDPRGENRKWIGIVPAGVYSGFRVHSDGTIDPGVLLTQEGIRIEETDVISVEVPPGHSTLNRYDLIVCRHEYLETYPNLEAHYEVIAGTPSDDLNPPIPNLPDHAVLLAYGRMQPGETTWSHVVQRQCTGHHAKSETGGRWLPRDSRRSIGNSGTSFQRN